MQKMKPRDRVLIALSRGVPDRVPWMENQLEVSLQERVMGTPDFEPADLCEKLGLDGFGYHFPLLGNVLGKVPLASKEEYYYPQKVTFDFFPPFIAEMENVPDLGRTFVKRGLLTTLSDDSYFQLPTHHTVRLTVSVPTCLTGDRS